jgi:hypothetical protein
VSKKSKNDKKREKWELFRRISLVAKKLNHGGMFFKLPFCGFPQCASFKEIKKKLNYRLQCYRRKSVQKDEKVKKLALFVCISATISKPLVQKIFFFHQ